MKISSRLSQKITNFVCSIILCICILFMNFIYIWIGGYSPLKFSSGYQENSSFAWHKSEMMKTDFYEENKNAKLIDEEISNWVIDILPHICRFVYEEYGVKVDEPECLIFESNEIKYAFSCFDKNTKEKIICVPTAYLNEKKRNLYSVLIHEIFHILTLIDGKFTCVSDNVDMVSTMAEGFTDILTDEFIDWYGLNISKRINTTLYIYYIRIINCILLEMPKEKFARFYFLHDSTLVYDFNERFSKNTNTFKMFGAFEKLDYRLYNINNMLVTNNELTDEGVYDLYSSLEIVMYYCKDYSLENKQKCLVYFDDMIIFFRIYAGLSKYVDDAAFNNNLEYLKGILA